jgi:predicted ATPase
MAAGEEPRPRLFVSYASADRDRVLPLVASIEDAGIDVWLDRDDIGAGEHYGTAISDGIRGSAALAIMCTATALRSPNVKQEIMLGWKHRRPYLPLLLEPVRIPVELEYWLEGCQWIEVFDYPAPQWLPRITAAVRRESEGATVAGEESAPPGSALRSASVDLPPAPTLVGRRQELAAVASLVRDPSRRIVTLTGPGGTGKSRLALAAAWALAAEFGEVRFVDLAPVADAALVLPTIASVLGIREAGGPAIFDQLVAALVGRRLLLLLDNFEHVLGAAPEIGRLSERAPGLELLVTSRIGLDLYEEQEFPVPPLEVPVDADKSSPDALGRVTAVELFILRARAHSPAFALDAGNAADIAEICRRLDGLPLAIELAAARSRLLPPRAMLTRMAQVLPLLTGGSRDLPARQRTLTDTIAWSYNLLPDAERQLFRRLAVFDGGWTLEAARSVCQPDDEDEFAFLEQLATLLKHNLVRQVTTHPEPRFRFLETIRQFAAAQLAAAGERDELCRRLLDYFQQFALSVARELQGDSYPARSRQLYPEHDNVRAAIRFAVESGTFERGMLLIGGLGYWFFREFPAEGARLASDLLERSGAEISPLGRCLATTAAMMCALGVGDMETARQRANEAEPLARAIGDPRLLTEVMSWVMILMPDDQARALAAFQEVTGIAEAQGNRWLLGWAHTMVWIVHAYRGDWETARRMISKGHELSLTAGDRWMTGFAAQGMGVQALIHGDLAAAQRHLGECLAVFEQDDISGQIASASLQLARLAQLSAQYDLAERLVQRSLRLSRRRGCVGVAVMCVPALGILAGLMGAFERGARLLGAAETIRKRTNSFSLELSSVFVQYSDALDQEIIPRLRAAAGEEQFDAWLAQGRLLSDEEAFTLALGADASV